MSLLEIMKKAGIGAVEATNPVALSFGQVVSSAPLSVLVDQRFALTSEYLIVPERLLENKVTIGQQEIVIRRKLEVDDRVLLLRVQGGQQYIVLDRVVSV